MSVAKIIVVGLLVAFGAVTATATQGFAQSGVRIEGQVQAGGGPLANSTVTLWAASAGEPRQLAQARTNDDGRFELGSQETPGADVILYVVAKGGTAAVNKGAGDNPAAALLAVLGNMPPPKVVINEMTTVASVWTHAQFLNGAAIRGHALGLKIAAGNVPSFVDLQTGGWGDAIQGPLNSGQTPTMANFATLADLLAGCATRVKADACSKLFAAATPPTGVALSDTLTAAQSIARYSWYKPERLFDLVGEFYPVPQGKNLRPVPFMPYLNFSPSAWVLPLKFDGGGYRAGGKAMFDSEGNLWVGDNFTVGWQGQDALWEGHATKFSPNGKPLSPITTGYCQTNGEYTSTLEFKLLKTSEAAQPPPATAQTPNVEEPTPEPSPSDATEDKLSNDPSAQPTRTRQTSWIEDPWPMVPPSGVVASEVPGNSLVLAPTPEQPPSIQESKSRTNEAHSFMNLAPWIIALNVALPLLSILFLVITLSRMDRVARTTGEER